MCIRDRHNPSCKAHVLLEKIMVDRQIEPTATPATVYKLSPEFKKYSLTVFRTAFNELKAKTGLTCNI